MRKTAGNENGFSGNNGKTVHHGESLFHPSLQRFAAEDRGIEPIPEADQQIRFHPFDSPSGENDPRLGFSESGMEQSPGRLPVRMRLNGKTDRRIQQLGQKSGPVSRPPRQIGSKKALPLPVQKTVEPLHRTVLPHDPAHPFPRLRMLRVSRLHCRRDPLLRKRSVLRLFRSAPPLQLRPAPVDPPHPVRKKFHHSFHKNLLSRLFLLWYYYIVP